MDPDICIYTVVVPCCRLSNFDNHGDYCGICNSSCGGSICDKIISSTFHTRDLVVEDQEMVVVYEAPVVVNINL